MSDLIGLTPGERDVAKAAVARYVPANKAEEVVDLVIDVINSHRIRVNDLMDTA